MGTWSPTWVTRERGRWQPGIHVSSSAELLRTLIEGPPVEKARLLMGYAGWGAGQLDRELTESSWLISDVATEIVFDTNPAGMWEAAIPNLQKLKDTN